MRLNFGHPSSRRSTSKAAACYSGVPARDARNSGVLISPGDRGSSSARQTSMMSPDRLSRPCSACRLHFRLGRLCSVVTLFGLSYLSRVANAQSSTVSDDRLPLYSNTAPKDHLAYRACRGADISGCPDATLWIDQGTCAVMIICNGLLVWFCRRRTVAFLPTVKSPLYARGTVCYRDRWQEMANAHRAD